MRVLVLTPDFPPAIGGIQTLVHRVVHGFEHIDARVVAVGHPDAAGFDGASGISTRRTPFRIRPHGARIALLNAAAVTEARRFRPQVVLAAHIVCAPSAALIKRRLRIPYDLYLYADEVSGSRHLGRFAMTHARQILVISGHTRSLAVAAGGRPDAMRLVLPGVDPPRAASRAKRERPTVLTVASLLRRYKGHDVMIRALPEIAAEFPDVEWLVVGSGPLEPEYRRAVQAAGLSEHVTFCGRLSDEERDALLHSSHVFAMPSRLERGGGGGEGFGIAFLEAGAHGLPVVAGNVGGALDAVVDGETGVLVDPTNASAVAAAIQRFLRDPREAQAFGARGRRFALDQAWPHVASRVEQVLLAERPPVSCPA